MKTGRSGIIAGCLIIIILICLLLPIVPQTSEYFGSPGTDAGLQLVSNPLHNSIPVLDNSTVRNTFQKTPVRKPDGSIYRLGTMQALAFSMEQSVQLQPVDMRSMIRVSIPQYFNGSKYKPNHLNSF
jgi:hypothetical protein